MDKSRKFMAVILALLAAIFYAINTPFSKVLLNKIPPTLMASFLYLGAGTGVGIMYLFHKKVEEKYEKLNKSDLPYTIGMIVLDIVAPIFLMIGINIGSASNASLLGNFEIVATTIIALLIFREKVTSKLWIAIGFITVSSIVLSVEGAESFKFSLGSLFVILATCCWGLENNCTRKISDKSTYEIVLLKGFFSGSGAFIVALILGERIPEIKYIIAALLLGFVAYGLSIFITFLAFIVNGEKLTLVYFIGLVFMIIGSVIVVYDTIVKRHSHSHSHIIVHTHDGKTHTHIIMHKHEHSHFISEKKHNHKHKDYMNSKEHKLIHEKGL